jgi:hypothetical protein
MKTIAVEEHFVTNHYQTAMKAVSDREISVPYMANCI